MSTYLSRGLRQYGDNFDCSPGHVVYAAAAEIDDLMDALWEIYVTLGADTDGASRWHCATPLAIHAAVDAVKQLRRDYDEALQEIPL